MCWTTKCEPVKKVAEKDIVCYKVMYLKEDGKIESGCKHFKYEEHKEYVSKLETPYCRPSYEHDKIIHEISKGIHTYMGISNVYIDDDDTVCIGKCNYDVGGYWEYVDYPNTKISGRPVKRKADLAICRCHIPKNGEYYENNTLRDYNSEIVSDRIIIDEHIRIGNDEASFIMDNQEIIIDEMYKRLKAIQCNKSK